MARLSRITVPKLPHHVTQRGDRGRPIFLEDGDYAIYRDLMAERCRANGVRCLAYCLMPNHVHLVLVPASADGLSRAVGEAHRRYTAFFNARARTTGALFQGRFTSAVMDKAHFLAAARYLAFIPVRAGLTHRVAQWRWSSARAHLAGRDDALVQVSPLLELAGDPRAFFSKPGAEEAALFDIETRPVVGRPLGANAFLAKLERKLHRPLAPRRPGRKPRRK